jgi:hypothetical protein
MPSQVVISDQLTKISVIFMDPRMLLHLMDHAHQDCLEIAMAYC